MTKEQAWHELQENSIYFIIGFLAAVVLNIFISPLWVIGIGFGVIILKEVISRHDFQKTEEKK